MKDLFIVASSLLHSLPSLTPNPLHLLASPTPSSNGRLARRPCTSTNLRRSHDLTPPSLELVRRCLHTHSLLGHSCFGLKAAIAGGNHTAHRGPIFPTRQACPLIAAAAAAATAAGAAASLLGAPCAARSRGGTPLFPMRSRPSTHARLASLAVPPARAHPPLPTHSPLSSAPSQRGP